jgi:hypothetical protein
MARKHTTASASAPILPQNEMRRRLSAFSQSLGGLAVFQAFDECRNPGRAEPSCRFNTLTTCRFFFAVPKETRHVQHTDHNVERSHN